MWYRSKKGYSMTVCVRNLSRSQGGYFSTVWRFFDEVFQFGLNVSVAAGLKTFLCSLGHANIYLSCEI